MQAIALLTLGVVVIAALSLIVDTLRLGIGPVPTSGSVKDLVITLVPADLDGELHELGAGWGTLAFALARQAPKARVIAWELSPLPFAFCWLRRWINGLSNVELRRRDFFTADLTRARLVTCYLFTGAMQRLATKFAAELTPGTVIITHTFALRGWAPEQTLHARDLYRTPVYSYVAQRSVRGDE